LLELPIVEDSSSIQSSGTVPSTNTDLIDQLEEQLKGFDPESPQAQSIISRLKVLDPNNADSMLKEQALQGNPKLIEGLKGLMIDLDKESPTFLALQSRLNVIEAYQSGLKTTPLETIQKSAPPAPEIPAPAPILKAPSIIPQLELNASSDFDAAYYAQNNPDVVAVYGNDPAKMKEHF